MAERARTGRRAARSARVRGDAPASPEKFARRLGLVLGAPVTLEVTDNTYTMVSFTRRGAGYRVRLHHMFLRAPAPILPVLAQYIRGDDRAASLELDAYIHAHRRFIRHLTPRARQRRLTLESRGVHHDLQAILEGVRSEHAELFGSDTRGVAIAWAPAPLCLLPRRSIKLGSYSADTQIIRIHPALDQAVVPDYFVRWIVFHELLHHRFRADLKARNGRVHTAEFNALERRCPRFLDALAWERRHLDLLLWWDPFILRLRKLDRAHAA